MEADIIDMFESGQPQNAIEKYVNSGWFSGQDVLDLWAKCKSLTAKLEAVAAIVGTMPCMCVIGEIPHHQCKRCKALAEIRE